MSKYTENFYISISRRTIWPVVQKPGKKGKRPVQGEVDDEEESNPDDENPSTTDPTTKKKNPTNSLDQQGSAKKSKKVKRGDRTRKTDWRRQPKIRYEDQKVEEINLNFYIF